jgi:hypothetical protein
MTNKAVFFSFSYPYRTWDLPSKSHLLEKILHFLQFSVWFACFLYPYPYLAQLKLGITSISFEFDEWHLHPSPYAIPFCFLRSAADRYSLTSSETYKGISNKSPRCVKGISNLMRDVPEFLLRLLDYRGFFDDVFFFCVHYVLCSVKHSDTFSLNQAFKRRVHSFS